MVHSGILRPVRLQVAVGAEVRRHLFDREDLDRLVAEAKA
jgi:hypothetical protein